MNRGPGGSRRHGSIAAPQPSLPYNRAKRLIRAAGQAERAAAAAADPAVWNDGNRTAAALEDLITAAREMVAALESHVSLVERAEP